MKRWQYRHTVLALCSLSFAFYHAARQSLPPAIPLIKTEMGLSYTQAGFAASAYDLGYAVTLILGGYLADRLNRTLFIFVGLLWLSFTLFLTSTADNFTTLAIYRALTGMAFGTYFSTGISLISSYFPKSERGSALGIHTGMGAGAGKLLTPLVAGLTLESMGWRPIFYFVVVPALVTAIIFWRLVKEPIGETRETLPFLTVVSQVVSSRTLILLGLGNATIIAGVVTLYSFLPLYLVNTVGTSLAFGSYSVAILNGISIPAVSLFGFLSDRFGRRVVILCISLATAVALPSFTYLRGDVWIVVGILAMGVVVGASFPTVITYVVDLTPLPYRSTAIGYVNTFAVIGGATGTVISGYISDYFGIVYVFPFLGLLALISIACIWPVKEPHSGTIQMGASSRT